jgi:hypothetical protein
MHTVQAFELLQKAYATESDLPFRAILLSAMALTRQKEANDFLLQLIRTESLEAETAIESMRQSMLSPDTIGELKEAVSDNMRLKMAFRKHFPD